MQRLITKRIGHSNSAPRGSRPRFSSRTRSVASSLSLSRQAGLHRDDVTSPAKSHAREKANSMLHILSDWISGSSCSRQRILNAYLFQKCLDVLTIFPCPLSCEPRPVHYLSSFLSSALSIRQPYHIKSTQISRLPTSAESPYDPIHPKDGPRRTRQ